MEPRRRPKLPPPPQTPHPPCPSPPQARQHRLPPTELDAPTSSLLLSHIPIHTYIYIQRGSSPTPLGPSPSSPFYMAAHPLEDGALHTL
ncbi:hypothetical protein HanIR_Chr13g0627411 [Helianthus annuus]|nr:hypothetical protein HanIR_Chr13g0627411 [Helianthus annuus]